MNDILDLKIIRIYRMPKDGAIKAFVDIQINDAIVVKGLRVVEGPNGLFVTMPQEKGKNERWYNTVHCLTKEIQIIVSNGVLSAYRESLARDERLEDITKSN